MNLLGADALDGGVTVPAKRAKKDSIEDLKVLREKISEEHLMKDDSYELSKPRAHKNSEDQTFSN